MHELAIGAVFKRESAFLREWIEYHRLVGVTHFWLLDNDDEDAEIDRVDAALRPYGRDLVTRIPFRPWDSLQEEGYAGLLRLAGGMTKWLALIDVDEYLTPYRSDSVVETLQEFDQPDIAAVMPHWRIFGSSGHLTTQPLTIDAYRQCSQVDFKDNGVMKAIARPLRCLAAQGHTITPAEGCRMVDEHFRTVHQYRAKPISYDKLGINHYYVRSVADWRGKIERGFVVSLQRGIGFSREGQDAEHRWSLLNRNETTEPSILRFVPRLRQALETL